MYLRFASPAHVAAELRQSAVAGESPLWLLCVADTELPRVPELLESCRGEGVRVCGGVFPGLIHGTRVVHNGLLALPLQGASQVAVADLSAAGPRWRTPPSGAGAHSAYVLLDSLAAGIAAFLDDLFDRFGGSLRYVGAGAACRDLRRAPVVFTGDGLWADAALAVLTPERMEVHVRHGWTRVLGPFVASRSRANSILELNWRPAAALYRQSVEALAPALAGRPVFPDLGAAFPLCIGREDSEDVIRDPMGETDDGGLAVLADVAEHSPLYIAHGTPESLVAAARQAVEACAAGPRPARYFISDCYSRALMLGAGFRHELAGVATALAALPEAVPEGVLALGEIASGGTRLLEFYNKTFVIAASRP